MRKIIIFSGLVLLFLSLFAYKRVVYSWCLNCRLGEYCELFGATSCGPEGSCNSVCGDYSTCCYPDKDDPGGGNPGGGNPGGGNPGNPTPTPTPQDSSTCSVDCNKEVCLPVEGSNCSDDSQCTTGHKCINGQCNKCSNPGVCCGNYCVPQGWSCNANNCKWVKSCKKYACADWNSSTCADYFAEESTIGAANSCTGVQCGNTTCPVVESDPFQQCSVGAPPAGDPSPPTGLYAICNWQENKVYVQWDDVQGYDYAVRVDNKKNGWSGDCNNLNEGDYCVNQTDNPPYKFNFEPNTPYAIWVHSIDEDNSRWSQANNIDPEPFYCLTPPENVRVENANWENQKATITWDPVPNAKYYALRIDKGGDWSGSCSPNKLNPGDSCPVVDTNSYEFDFVPDEPYYIWVHSVSENGYASDYASHISPEPYYFLSCKGGYQVQCSADGTQATISWNPNNKATAGYILRVNNLADGWFTEGSDHNLSTTNTTETILITPGALYNYSIQGVFQGEPYPFKGEQCPNENFFCQPPTPTPGMYARFKDSSFNDKTNYQGGVARFNDYIHESVEKFKIYNGSGFVADPEDEAVRYVFVVSNNDKSLQGVVSLKGGRLTSEIPQGVNDTPLSQGVSYSKRFIENYGEVSPDILGSFDNILDYFQSFKDYEEVSSFSDIENNSKEIVVLKSSFDWKQNNLNKTFNKIVIFDGTVVFGEDSFKTPPDLFNVSDSSDNIKDNLVVVARKIVIKPSVHKLYGIFMADEIEIPDSNTGNPYGLKIKGNIITFNSFTLNRKLNDNKSPVMFVVKDIKPYLYHFANLSIIKRDER